MRAGALLLVLMVLVPANSPAFDLLPRDRFRTPRVELGYRQPWPDLPIHDAWAGLRLVDAGGVRAGVSVGFLGAPTVVRRRGGAWLQFGESLRLEAQRSSIRVEGIDDVPALDVGVFARGSVNAWGGGWSVTGESLRDPVAPAVWRRQAWAGRRAGPFELVLVRRSIPWSGRVEWGLGAAMRLRTGAKLVVRWSDAQTFLALAWRNGEGAVAVRTAWTGPRAGGFGLRSEWSP